MTALQAALLGLIEGLTEFLPVSSTGHLILAARLMALPDSEFVKSFQIFIQLGALLAVVWLYWRSLFLNKAILKRVFTAFLPTAAVGLAVYPLVKRFLLANPYVVIVALIIGGIFIILFERFYKEKEGAVEDLSRLNYKTALAIGGAQTLAIIPGVSRSAVTIIGGRWLGFKPKAIVDFSFLLAVPTLVAATGLDLAKSSFDFSRQEWVLLAIGFFTAMAVAVLTVKFLLLFIKKHTFAAFGVYRIVFGLLFWFFWLR